MISGYMATTINLSGINEISAKIPPKDTPNNNRVGYGGGYVIVNRVRIDDSGAREIALGRPDDRHERHTAAVGSGRLAAR
jgi:hypothetical protein